MSLATSGRTCSNSTCKRSAPLADHIPSCSTREGRNRFTPFSTRLRRSASVLFAPLRLLLILNRYHRVPSTSFHLFVHALWRRRAALLSAPSRPRVPLYMS